MGTLKEEREKFENRALIAIDALTSVSVQTGRMDGIRRLLYVAARANASAHTLLKLQQIEEEEDDNTTGTEIS